MLKTRFFGLGQVFSLLLCAAIACTSVAAEQLSPLERLHPRSLNQIELYVGGKVLIELCSKARLVTQMPIPEEPALFSSLDADGRVTSMRLVQKICFSEENAVLTLALAGLLSSDYYFINQAKTRALKLASWDPRGATGFFEHDQAARAIAWSLALVFDWLNPYWTREEKARLLGAVRPRVEDMLSAPVNNRPSGWAGLDWGRKLDKWPYDSHGVVNTARLAVICSVLAGEDNLFDICVREIVPRYIDRPIPWGGWDGGFANGTAYAHWGLLGTHFIAWHLLRNALGYDLWQRDWARGYLYFIAYFLPPGTPSGLFGDEAEKRFTDVWATQAKAYAAALPSPLADWCALSQFGENPLHLALLLAPTRNRTQTPTPLPPGTPHSKYLPDIGWVAMHSDLGDRTRTSVYFKSSPYGSYNHSHADQNSFVIHTRGQVLAADSGYYDYYNSPHWKDWYKQTRAHNAITFDGGQGQLHDTMAAKGKITHFEHNDKYDITTGDATEAYGRALTQAKRSIVYLRPGTVLVNDSLTSETPRTWEWNLHALSRMNQKGLRELEVVHDGICMHVTLLDAPNGGFSQTDRFTTEPQGSYPKQWHSRYSTTEKSRETRFLALLDIGCRNPSTELLEHGTDKKITVEGLTFIFDKEGNVRFVP